MDAGGLGLLLRLDVKICQDEFLASSGEFFESEEIFLFGGWGEGFKKLYLFFCKFKTAPPKSLLIKIVVSRKLTGGARFGYIVSPFIDK